MGVFAALVSIVLMGADCVQCGSMYVQCLFAPTCSFLFYLASFVLLEKVMLSQANNPEPNSIIFLSTDSKKIR